MPECYIRGSTIKYLRIPDEIIDMVKEEVVSKGRGRGGMQQQKQQKGRGVGGAGRGNDPAPFWVRKGGDLGQIWVPASPFRLPGPRLLGSHPGAVGLREAGAAPVRDPGAGRRARAVPSSLLGWAGA